jgi:GT2 family glycosyltransferase
MSKPKVLVAVLCGPERYQWPAPGLMMRLIEAVQVPDVSVNVVPVFGVYGYDAARNRAAEFFMNGDADFLLMLDNDNAPPADFIRRVLEFADSRSDVDVIGLPYYTRPRFGMVNTVLCAGWHASEPNTFDMPTQLPAKWQEVDVAGAGCMFIRRAVLSTLEKPWFRIPTHAFREHFMSGACEDTDFCDRVKAAGFHIWTHGGLICSHLHTVALEAIAAATVTRAEEEMEILRKLGINIPTIRRIEVAR